MSEKESNHSHQKGGSHSHIPTTFGRVFAISAVLNIALVVAQVVYGLAAHSTALLADAAHNSGDVIGLLLAWGAYAISQKRPTERYTYGFRSSTILAALFNGMLLLIATGAIVWEAIRRLMEPTPVEGGMIIIVAIIGILVNSFSAFLLARGNKDLNIKSAFWHLVSDAAVSVGVVITGVIVLYTGATWADPFASIVISVAIVWSTWGLFRDAMQLSLQAVPSHIDIAAVRSYLEKIPGSSGIHDLHVWPISTTETALTCHITERESADHLHTGQLADDIQKRFGIQHATIQVESKQDALKCRLEPNEVI